MSSEKVLAHKIVSISKKGEKVLNIKNPNKSFSFGTDPSCQVRLREVKDAGFVAVHCQVTPIEGKMFLVSNGNVSVNGQATKGIPVALHSGDVISLGNKVQASFRYETALIDKSVETTSATPFKDITHQVATTETPIKVEKSTDGQLAHSSSSLFEATNGSQDRSRHDDEDSVEDKENNPSGVAKERRPTADTARPEREEAPKSDVPAASTPAKPLSRKLTYSDAMVPPPQSKLTKNNKKALVESSSSGLAVDDELKNYEDNEGEEIQQVSLSSARDEVEEESVEEKKVVKTPKKQAKTPKKNTKSKKAEKVEEKEESEVESKVEEEEAAKPVKQAKTPKKSAKAKKTEKVEEKEESEVESKVEEEEAAEEPKKGKKGAKTPKKQTKKAEEKPAEESEASEVESKAEVEEEPKQKTTKKGAKTPKKNTKAKKEAEKVEESEEVSEADQETKPEKKAAKTPKKNAKAKKAAAKEESEPEKEPEAEEESFKETKKTPKKGKSKKQAKAAEKSEAEKEESEAEESEQEEKPKSEFKTPTKKSSKTPSKAYIAKASYDSPKSPTKSPRPLSISPDKRYKKVTQITGHVTHEVYSRWATKDLDLTNLDKKEPMKLRNSPERQNTNFLVRKVYPGTAAKSTKKSKSKMGKKQASAPNSPTKTTKTPMKSVKKAAKIKIESKSKSSGRTADHFDAPDERSRMEILNMTLVNMIKEQLALMNSWVSFDEIYTYHRVHYAVLNMDALRDIVKELVKEEVVTMSTKSNSKRFCLAGCEPAEPVKIQDELPENETDDDESEDEGDLRNDLQHQMMQIWLRVKGAKSEKLPNAVAPFMHRPNKKKYPEYYASVTRVVTMKMTLQSIKAGDYETMEDMAKDFRQMFVNFKRFNRPKSPVYRCGALLEKEFKAAMKAVKDAANEKHGESEHSEHESEEKSESDNEDEAEKSERDEQSENGSDNEEEKSGSDNEEESAQESVKESVESDDE
jgi:hypothetical protein